MNAIFGLSMVMSLSDRMVVVLATGTAVYLSALPKPDIPKVCKNDNYSLMCHFEQASFENAMKIS